MRSIKISGRMVGEGFPVYIVAEIGINHNGDINMARKLIDLAVTAGCDAVKFQKRTPELCVPAEFRDKMRDTPWGYISYLEYRHRVEFGEKEYENIDRYCRDRGIAWFASCWDEPSVDFITRFDVPCLKIPSACLTDRALLRHFRRTSRPLVLSTGMSTMEEISAAVDFLQPGGLLLTHCTSTYPCPPGELNLRMIRTLRKTFPCPVGYSGHEVGLPTTTAAVALGACLVERHITLDRAMWGSDQAASIAPVGLLRLVKHIRTLETALGDGVKRVCESELPVRQRLRRVKSDGVCGPTAS